MPANSQISRKIVSLARPPFGVISSLRRPAKTAMALRAGDKGFTLVEMLIALFIFAIISIGTTTTMTNSLRGKEKIDQRLEVMQNLETVRAVIKADMSHIILRPSRDILGSQARYKLSGGVTDLMNFTRAGRANPGGLYARSDLQRVRYVFENGQLIRRHLGHENPAPNTPEIDRVLLSDLQSARMSFIKGPIEDSRIFIENDDIIEISAVKLALVFNNGDQLDQYFELGL